MPQISVFGFRLSPLVEKVVRALEYKALAFELVTPSSMADSKEWNPETGKMPVIDIDGERVHDSTFIVRRIEEIEPDPPLTSGDPVIAAQQRLLEDWSDESLYWQIMALRWCDENRARTVAELRPFLPAAARPFAGPLLRRLIARTPAVQGLGRLPYDVLIRETGERLDDLVLLLGRRAFFYADRPSVADFALYGEFRTGCGEATPDFGQLVSERPPLADWLKRVEDATSR